MTKENAFSALMHLRHLKLMRTIGFVLTLGTQDAWRGLVTVFEARLTVEERAELAFMALKSLDRHDAIMTAEAALSAGAGQPQVPLFDYADQAAFWVDFAEPEELDAYAVEIFDVMETNKKRLFADYVAREVA